MKNSEFYNFAFTLLLMHKAKYIFTFILFFIIVFIVCSVLFISTSMKNNELQALRYEPQILVENHRGGRQSTVDEYYLEEASKIKGVNKVFPRVYGEYYFRQSNKYFSIVGVDLLNDSFNEKITKFGQNKIKYANEDVVFVGKSIKKELEKFHYTDEITLFTYSGDAKIVKIIYINDDEFELLSNNSIFCNISLAREILGLEKFEYSDFYIDVPNDTEVPNIVEQLKKTFWFAKITTKKEKIAQIYNNYYYKGGIFLSLFVFAIVSFMILLYQKTITAISSEKKEIGILRAIGWKISDIIKLKIVQNLFVAFSAFFIGMIFAYIFVFIFGAPFLRNIFIGSYASFYEPNFRPFIKISEIVILFLLTVVPFMASILFPAWKLSTTDSSESVK